jgi:hypothetical protein
MRPDRLDGFSGVAALDFLQRALLVLAQHGPPPEGGVSTRSDGGRVLRIRIVSR